MKSTVALGTLIGFIASMVPSAVGAATLYASDDQNDSIYTLNTSTGAATLVGPTGVDLSLTGLAYDTSTRTLYISDAVPPSNSLGLGIVDPHTGAVTYVGPHVTSINIHGLAYDSRNDTLYGADINNGGGLSIINRATGASTFVGAWVITTQIRGMAYDAATDTLYGIDRGNSASLYTIDRNTGAATLVGPLGVAPGAFEGLEVDPDTGILYAADDSTGNLFRIDKTTGAVSVVGPTGIQVSGLAAIPSSVGAPTLSSAALCLLVLLLTGLGAIFVSRQRDNNSARLRR